MLAAAIAYPLQITRNHIAMRKMESELAEVHRLASEMAAQIIERQGLAIVRKPAAAELGLRDIKDSWGHPYRYQVWSDAKGRPLQVAVWSAGPNGQFETPMRSARGANDFRFRGDDIGAVVNLANASTTGSTAN